MTDPFSVPSPTAAAGARLVLLVTLAAFSWDSSAAHAQPEAPELDRDPPRDDADAELSDAELEALFETVARDVTSPPPRTRAPARRRTELRDEDLTLREVVVTGTRRETPIEDSPVQTEVISRADIETSGAETLAELLEEHAGPRTGPGVTTAIFVLSEDVAMTAISTCGAITSCPISARNSSHYAQHSSRAVQCSHEHSRSTDGAEPRPRDSSRSEVADAARPHPPSARSVVVAWCASRLS